MNDIPSGVLVLNQSFEPLAVARAARALALIERGKAERLAVSTLPIRTSSGEIPRPSVIRLFAFVKRPRPQVRFSRRAVFMRDGHQCQYCDARPKNLTIDHVIPLSRGGRDWWENVVSSCVKCNHKKGAKTPAEAHLVLKQQPFEPRVTSPLYALGVQPSPEWLAYLPASE
jgi:5-methylcytosine-specific restriction endonuclease McrA